MLTDSIINNILLPKYYILLDSDINNKISIFIHLNNYIYVIKQLNYLKEEFEYLKNLPYNLWNKKIPIYKYLLYKNNGNGRINPPTEGL